MTPILRWVRFNLVGAMGMGVQLGALAVMNRWMDGHYLWASAAALELTLLHNFAWHQYYTWRDRLKPGQTAARLVRFHLSNGAVSLAGNLGLMQVMVTVVHVPVVAANMVAIAACSMVNFCLGDRWAFPVAAATTSTEITFQCNETRMPNTM